MKCYIDGSCGPNNPGGNMGIGVYLEDGTKLSSSISSSPFNTNNVAEYLALQLLLEHLSENNITEATIYSDSKLLVNQMTGKWKIKHGAYTFYAEICKKLLSELDCKVRWIPREENTIADELSKYQR